MKSVIANLLTEEKAQGLIEYGLLISIVAIALILAVRLLGDSVLFSLSDSKVEILDAIK